MMKNKIIFVIGMTMLIMMTLTGCLRTQVQEPAPTQTPTPMPTQAPTPTPTQAPENTESAEPAVTKSPDDVTNVVLDSDYVKNLLAKAAKLEGYKYQVDIVSNDETSEVFWVCGVGGKYKMQLANPEGNGRTTIFDKENGVYSYDLVQRDGYHIMREENIVTKLFLNEQDLSGKQFFYVSQENYNDLRCIVLQWNEGEDIVKRAWISEDYGLVVKMNVKHSEGTVVYSVSDVVIEKLPENAFEVPNDIIINER